MKTIQEGDLIFNVTSAINAERFDDNKLHGKKSTIKRVDFIIEHPDEFIFLEIKDPDIPDAANPNHFREQLCSGNLIPDLAGKFRDTLFFTSLRKKYEKPITYIVLICMKSLDKALILAKTDSLKSALPIAHKSWTKNSVDSCIILKLDAYKKRFGTESIWRSSDYE